MGIRIGALAGDADHVEQVDGPLPRGPLRLVQPVLDRLGDLIADPDHRVEGVHRALEDHADLAPTVALHRPLGLLHEVDPKELYAPAADLAVAGQELDQ